jgi:hypothetical protein
MATKLMTAFRYAVDAFNSGYYSKSLAPLLHNNVVMNQVDDPKAPPHAGIDNVIKYLVKTQSVPLPQFYYVPAGDPYMDGPKEAPEDTDGAAGQVLHAQINGIGKYQDVKNDNTTLKYVRYFFLFKRNSPNDDWLLVHATATPYTP